MKTTKIILDTNLWISFLISNKYNELDNFLFSHQVQLIFSDELLEEFLTVIEKPKLKKYFPAQKVTQLLQLFDFYGKLIPVTKNIKLCRDAKDDFLLNLAAEGAADYLVTGDKDLLVLKKIKTTHIITWNELLTKLQNHDK